MVSHNRINRGQNYSLIPQKKIFATLFGLASRLLPVYFGEQCGDFQRRKKEIGDQKNHHVAVGSGRIEKDHGEYEHPKKEDTQYRNSQVDFYKILRALPEKFVDKNVESHVRKEHEHDDFPRGSGCLKPIQMVSGVDNTDDKKGKQRRVHGKSYHSVLVQFPVHLVKHARQNAQDKKKKKNRKLQLQVKIQPVTHPGPQSNAS